MYYVYIIQSVNDQNSIYVGATSDLKRRFSEHNAGKSHYTAKHLPWELKFYAAFTAKEKAFEFEEYLKSGNGRLLVKKRLL